MNHHESRALNAITSPQFDPATREIRSDWRDGATRYGTDIYVFRDGGPVLVRKELKEYTGPGLYTLHVSLFVNGVWKVVAQRQHGRVGSAVPQPCAGEAFAAGQSGDVRRALQRRGNRECGRVQRMRAGASSAGMWI